MKNQSILPIGLFDSGVGGISVLAELMNLLPNEDYVYFGDSHHAPYGIKDTKDIKERSLQVADILMNIGVKLLVVACNTATSAAIKDLRERLDIPVIGMEPAIKPAITQTHWGKIVVMATPVTLKEKKFGDLIQQFKDGEAEIIKLPCPGLVEIIEGNGKSSDTLEEYLRNLYKDIDLNQVSTIVLGCTHYVFIKEAVKGVVGLEKTLIDGNLGTALHAKRMLENYNVLNNHRDEFKTQVQLLNSSPNMDMIHLSKRLLETQLMELQYKGSIKYI
ncbi:glutamate racemase [Alkaliphilus serpentinus]|uniref:Glutamate racemase n=1 Tax=Alkaliphilus serpentinus TaxID=1482731 RepID=A0A833MCN2_9FIRM|nr:glutamate racemase [Alkaliphilus serpentinus]KAB3525838.1 glutamate racemase [Alkaliphilus serpentinus]